jgi:hypothetical protein
MDSMLDSVTSIPLAVWVLFGLWLLLAFVAILLCASGVAGLWHRRLLGGASRLCCGLVLAGGVATVAAIGLGLQAYHRLTHEQDALHISFVRQAPGDFIATIRYPDGWRDEYRLLGEEWQVDARILRWKGPAVVAGMDTLFQVERVSGRHHELSREREGPRTVYQIARPQQRLDLWHLAQRYPDRVPWVDAIYGSATYLPMADGAEFEVRVTASGLAARPVNPAAREALRRW